MSWYLRVFQNYANFSDRAQRAEYWVFTIVNAVIYFVFSLLFELVGDENVQLVLTFIVFAYLLVLLVPSLTVLARRLHDTGHSGWSVFISLIPFVGGIILIIWLASDSDPEANKYGPNPKLETGGDFGRLGEQGATSPRRRAKWLLPFGVVALVAVIGSGAFLYVAYRGTEEARVLAPCTRINASAEQVANLDLTSLGLDASGTQDARALYGAGFVDGAVVEYAANGSTAAIVAAVRYAGATDATGAFSDLDAWAEQNCGTRLSFNFGATGVIHCNFSDGQDMMLWHENWILDIQAADLGALKGADLADQIRDLAAAHWQGLTTAQVSGSY